MPRKTSEKKAVDLSQVELSATSAYIDILPQLEALRDEPISEDEKVEKAKDIIIVALCKNRNEAETYYEQISQNYIVRTRITLGRYFKLEQIITFVNTAIENGKNYIKENKNHD